MHGVLYMWFERYKDGVYLRPHSNTFVFCCLMTLLAVERLPLNGFSFLFKKYIYFPSSIGRSPRIHCTQIVFRARHLIANLPLLNACPANYTTIQFQNLLINQI